MVAPDAFPVIKKGLRYVLNERIQRKLTTGAQKKRMEMWVRLYRSNNFPDIRNLNEKCGGCFVSKDKAQERGESRAEIGKKFTFIKCCRKGGPD
jgi:hypothetical protein